MADDTEHQPGMIAPVSGHYRLVNVFGTATSRSVHVRRGEPFPGARHLQSWRLERETDERE